MKIALVRYRCPSHGGGGWEGKGREAEVFIGALLRSRIRERVELRLALRGTSLPDEAELPDDVGTLPFA